MALLAGCSRKADPAPSPAQLAANNPDAPWATYTDAAGVTVTMSQAKAATATAPPLLYGGAVRRSVFFMGLLPDQARITINYSFTNTAYNGPGSGHIALDAPVTLYVTPQGVGGQDDFEMPAGPGVFVELVAPNTLNATYTGPIVKNGSNVTFTFNHIAL